MEKSTETRIVRLEKKLLPKFICLLLLIVNSIQMGLGQTSPTQSSSLETQSTERIAEQVIHTAERLLDEKKYQAAVEKFQESLKYKPHEPGIMCNYGLSLMGAGKPSAALVAFQKALQMNPNRADTWLNIGTCYQEMSKDREALEAFNTFLRLSPGSPYATQVKAMIPIIKKQMKDKESYANEDDSTYLTKTMRCEAVRWQKNKMPIKVYIRSGNNLSNYRSEFESILKESFLEWEQASNGLVKFAFITDSRNSDIQCSWVADAKELGNQDEGGRALATLDGYAIKSAQIKLLTRLGDSDNTIYRLYLHEIGHCLGLHHSFNPDDVMFYLAIDNNNKGLSQRDKNTLIALYVLN